jgi:antitoxin HigA-1
VRAGSRRSAANSRGLSQYRLAKDVSVPPRRINEIVHGKRAVTADTALRLARYFGTTPRFWLNLQAQYDLAIEADRLGDRLDREVTAHAGAMSSTSSLD